MASPAFWFADRVKGNGEVLIEGAAEAPVTVATLPAAHPVAPSVCVQKVTTGLERLMAILVYDPAGTVAEVPRKAESLVNRVKSTLNVVELRGMFTAAPVDGVSVMVFMSALKDSRLVFGGGVSGAATRVRLSVAVPPGQLTVHGPGGFGCPLQEMRKQPNASDGASRNFLKFIWPPRRENFPAPALA